MTTVLYATKTDGSGIIRLIFNYKLNEKKWVFHLPAGTTWSFDQSSNTYYFRPFGNENVEFSLCADYIYKLIPTCEYVKVDEHDIIIKL